MIIDKFDGEYFFLSNFYQHKIKYDEYFWDNNEQCFQATKTLDLAEKDEIRFTVSPGKAKRLGGKVHMRKDWDQIKVGVMKDINRIKFSDPVLKQKLLDTGDAELVEGNSWGDQFWGCCDGSGMNMLGKILMEIREELKGRK